MPIYEFRCNGCQRKLSLFVRSITDFLSPECPHCGGRQLARVMSGFAYHRSEQTRLEGEIPQPVKDL